MQVHGPFNNLGKPAVKPLTQALAAPATDSETAAKRKGIKELHGKVRELMKETGWDRLSHQMTDKMLRVRAQHRRILER
jgi:hypothetical protein